MTHKQEALVALAQLVAALRDDQPISPLRRQHLIVTATYVWEEVEAIQELKRPRRPPAIQHVQVVRHDEGGEA